MFSLTTSIAVMSRRPPPRSTSRSMRRRSAPSLPARRAQMLVGGRGKVGEGLRRVGREVLLRHPPEERADELPRHVPSGARDERARLVEQVALRRLRLCFCRHESLPAATLRP